MKKCALVTRIRAATLLAVVLFLGAGHALQAQNVVDYVRVDSLEVGDTFTYSLTLKKDKAYDAVIYPDSSQFGDSFEIRSRQHFKVTDFKDSLIYHLQYFGTADTQIPSMPVQLVADNDTTAVYTNPVPIYFKSLLQAEGEGEGFRPLKPIFDFARAWWPYIIALILLSFAGWYLYKWYRQKAEEPEPKPRPSFKPTPFVDPLAQLERSLKELRSFTFEEQQDFKQFYIHLGDAIRTYFEDLYKIPAMESTSREIIYELDRRMVDERMINQTRKVLRQADMVKFAKFEPTVEQTKISLSVAEEFLQVARNNDGPRVEQMRRQHQSRIEEQRRAFEEQNEDEEETETQELQNA